MFDADTYERAITARELRGRRRADQFEALKWGPDFSIPARDSIRADRREWNFQTNYDISTFEYEEMYSEQDGCCSICGAHREIDGVGPVDRLHVDHDHETGKVRSLLCQGCNTTLGHAKDSPDILRAAAAYLEFHEAC